MVRRMHSKLSLANPELHNLVEPLATYIVASNNPRVVLAAALLLLFSEVHEVDKAADEYLATIGQKRVG